MRDVTSKVVEDNSRIQDRISAFDASHAWLLHSDHTDANKAVDSREADVVERLMLLAASIVVDSHDHHVFQRFASTLQGLAKMIERDELGSSTVLDQPVVVNNVLPSHVNTAPILTNRQLEVLRLRAQGLRVRAIAERLNLTPSTIHSHVRDSIERLGVSGGVMAAVAEARRRGLL